MPHSIITEAVDRDGWNWQVNLDRRVVKASGWAHGTYHALLFDIDSQGALTGGDPVLAKDLPPELIPACKIAAGKALDQEGAETLELVPQEVVQVPREDWEAMKLALEAFLAGSDKLQEILQAVGIKHVLQVIQPPSQTSCEGCMALLSHEAPDGRTLSTCCINLGDNDPDSVERPQECRDLAEEPPRLATILV